MQQSQPFLAQGLVDSASLAHGDKARFADCGAVDTCPYWNQTLRAIHLVIYLFNAYLPSASEWIQFWDLRGVFRESWDPPFTTSIVVAVQKQDAE